jgi:signal peptidase I
MITNAIIGLIIILGSYTLLNTINPDLVNLNLGIKKVSITFDSAHEEEVLENLPSNKTFKKSTYYDTIKTLVGSKYNHCIMQAIMQIESGGTTSQIIGHDENVTRIVTTSRKPFVDSGRKGSGATFTKGDITVQNDDGANMGVAPNPSSTTLGLDLRWSHSVGMFGLTFFPPDGHATDGSGVKMKDIYNNTNNADLLWAVNFANRGWKKCGDPLGVFYFWAASGGCVATGNAAYDAIALQKKSLYDQCIAQDN